MALNPKKLRRLIAIAAVVLVAVVLGFYSYARYRINQELQDIPEKLGVNIQQSTEGFTFTKSDGGRKQFSISAKKAVQFKSTQQAALEDVRIIVYDRGTTTADDRRYDQIYGRRFVYDPKTGEVRAEGEVHIDLEAQGSPDEVTSIEDEHIGAVHLKASGLSFNQHSGIARTQGPIEFALPQASGSARGASYDADQRSLRLHADVQIKVADGASRSSSIGMNAATIDAASALITDSPREIQLEKVHIDQRSQTLDTRELSILLRDDGTVDRAMATGGVRGVSRSGEARSEVSSSDLAMDFDQRNKLRSAVLTGDVQFESAGPSLASGRAGRVELDFGRGNRLKKVRATQRASFQQSTPQQTTTLQSAAVDLLLRPDGSVDRALTDGPAELTIADVASRKTTATAGSFDARFGPRNRVSAVTGGPAVRIVSNEPGQPDRITSSDKIVAKFETGPGRAGALVSLEQSGNFKYTEGPRTITADRASFIAGQDVAIITGNPRVRDDAIGLALTANSLRLNRRTGEALAEGRVKATYSQLKPASGAMLAASDPIHLTAQTATAGRDGLGRFAGAARLWQGTSVVQAPVMEFDRNRRWIRGSVPKGAPGKVQTSFLQTDQTGKQVPVNITAASLTYSDPDRRALFGGGVTARSAIAVISANDLEVLLHSRSAASGGAQPRNQIQTITASGNLVIEQKNPARRAFGEKLVYTASDGKFELSGSETKPPSIFDAELGNITGDSLTFFSRDDKVQVKSGENSRTITQTRLKDDAKP